MSRPIDACEVLENRLRLYAPDFDADRIQPAAAEQFDVAVQYFQSLEIPPELQQLWSWCGHNRCTVPTRLSDGNRIGGTKFEKLAPALDFSPSRSSSRGRSG